MRLEPAVLTRATVEFRCPKNHVTSHPAPEVSELVDDGRGIRFKQYTECSECWQSVGAFGPPFAHVVTIWWGP